MFRTSHSNERTGRWRRIGARRGAALVEAAFVLPVVFLFIFGIFEYGRYVMTLHVVENAAREGARYAVTHTQPITIAGTTLTNYTSDVINRVTAVMPGISLQNQSIEVYESDSVGNNLGVWTDAQSGELICVRITGDFPFFVTGMLSLPATIPVRAQAVMRSESN